MVGLIQGGAKFQSVQDVQGTESRWFLLETLRYSLFKVQESYVCIADGTSETDLEVFIGGCLGLGLEDFPFTWFVVGCYCRTGFMCCWGLLFG